MRNTFKPGVYDFSERATFTHNENRFEAHYFVGDTIPNIINAYTELTGNPALMPEYSFYLGHADDKDNIYDNHSVDKSSGDNKLPKTATNTYNWMFAGLIIIGLGESFYISLLEKKD